MSTLSYLLPKLELGLPAQLALLVAAALLAILGVQLALMVVERARVNAALANLPEPPGGNWLYGHLVPMMTLSGWGAAHKWLTELQARGVC